MKFVLVATVVAESDGVTVFVRTALNSFAGGEGVVSAFGGATAPDTGSTTSTATSITAITQNKDFFIRNFLGSNYY
jgi:hypothetical protein